MMNLRESPFDRNEFAVRAGGHVAASQHAGEHVRRRLELQAQDAGESAFAGFDDGIGVMADQSAQHGVGVLGVAQVPGAVECMQARHGKAGRVADVVQPRGGFLKIDISAENGCQTVCPRGDALGVRPAAGQGILEERPGELFGPWSYRVHAAKLDIGRGTFTDVACRLKTSFEHQVPSSGTAGWPQRALARRSWRRCTVLSQARST
jgi:hypothetical protein